MKARRFGRIVNIASAHGLTASPFKSAYVTAKHGLIGLSKTVALEVAEFGITSNTICPGYVKTPLVDAQIADQASAHGISEADVVRDVLLVHQARKEFVRVDELAALAVFLASDAAASMTGERDRDGRRLDPALIPSQQHPETNMANAPRTTRKTKHGLPGQVVLVLQGGGALGAYQVGVYQALHEAGIEPDWVIGTSIGAINAALICGNEPAASAGPARCILEPGRAEGLRRRARSTRSAWPACSAR